MVPFIVVILIKMAKLTHTYVVYHDHTVVWKIPDSLNASPMSASNNGISTQKPQT